jgi:peptidoglycan-associated lipoprotein
MKKFLSLILLGSLLLAGCAKNATVDQPTVTDPAANTATAPPQTTATSDTKAPAETKAVAAADSMQKIFFDFDSYLLTPASKDALQKNAGILQAQPEVRVIIEGHTDERGSSNYNLALGEKRAQAARAYLQTLGITAERIKVVSYGEEQPAMTGADESAWSQNRRAEFVPAN